MALELDHLHTASVEVLLAHLGQHSTWLLTAERVFKHRLDYLKNEMLRKVTREWRHLDADSLVSALLLRYEIDVMEGLLRWCQERQQAQRRTVEPQPVDVTKVLGELGRASEPGCLMQEDNCKAADCQTHGPLFKGPTPSQHAMAREIGRSLMMKTVEAMDSGRYDGPIDWSNLKTHRLQQESRAFAEDLSKRSLDFESEPTGPEQTPRKPPNEE